MKSVMHKARHGEKTPNLKFNLIAELLHTSVVYTHERERENGSFHYLYKTLIN